MGLLGGSKEALHEYMREMRFYSHNKSESQMKNINIPYVCLSLIFTRQYDKCFFRKVSGKALESERSEKSLAYPPPFWHQTNRHVAHVVKYKKS